MEVLPCCNSLEETKFQDLHLGSGGLMREPPIATGLFLVNSCKRVLTSTFRCSLRTPGVAWGRRWDVQHRRLSLIRRASGCAPPPPWGRSEHEGLAAFLGGVD